MTKENYFLFLQDSLKTKKAFTVYAIAKKANWFAFYQHSLVGFA